MLLKILISRLSAAFYWSLQLISFFLSFLVIFELIDLQGPINFFRPCRYNTAPISETKFGFEHILEIGIFKGIKFCLRGKSLKVLAMIIYLFSLFDCLFLSFFVMIFDFVCVLAGIVDLICWSSRVILSFHSILWIVFQDLSCYVFFTSSNRFLFRQTLTSWNWLFQWLLLLCSLNLCSWRLFCF